MPQQDREIQAGRLHEIALENILVASQCGAAGAAVVEDMDKAALTKLAPVPHQPPPAPAQTRLLCKYTQTPVVREEATSRARVDASWDNFMNHGYSMMPLELRVNGRLMKRALLEPPRNQIIFGHASAAEQVFVANLKDASRDNVLALEPLGIIHYAPGNASYTGASIVTTFPAKGGIGAGLMLHSSRLGHLAGIWQRTPANANRIGALLSIDLYGRLTSAADKVKAFKAQALANCLQDAKCLSDLTGQSKP